jgi:IclR family transcriptional regulator, acetate operon repressor
MSGVQSVARAFELLRAVAVEPAGITELAARAGLPKSTVARLLSALEREGAVNRDDEDRLYVIGVGLAELAGAIDASAALATAVRPHLQWLASELGEAAGFSVPTGYTMQYVVQVESPNPVQVRDYTGLTVPMHVGPSGLCMMAQWPSEDLERYLGRPLASFTPHTINDPVRIRSRLEEIRKAGHCWIHEEFAEGINSVAAPVFASGHRALGSIHVHGPAYRFPPPGRSAEIGAMVIEAAERFSTRAESK